MKEFRVLLCGECAISVELGDSIDLETNYRVHRLSRLILEAHIRGITEVNPTYRSLLIRYEPLLCSLERLLTEIHGKVEESSIDLSMNSRTVDVPVCYGGSFGPDLGELAGAKRITIEEAIQIHTAPEYHVYMIGFTLGFPYLGGLDERLWTTRRLAPRERVPRGSIGIADRQTGIYTVESPGGWHLVGKTPLRLFDISKEEPSLLTAGDRVKFRSISEEEYWGIEGY